MKKLLIILIATILLSSCGKKGPLTLPDGEQLAPGAITSVNQLPGEQQGNASNNPNDLTNYKNSQ